MALDYPTRSVRLIVGFAAGGGSDIVARLIGQQFAARLGQQFFVDNRTGAASNIAAEAVVNAPPDGYTLPLATTGNAVNATLYDKLNFDFARDIVPVAPCVRVPNILEIHPSVPARTVPEFIKLWFKQPSALVVFLETLQRRIMTPYRRIARDPEELRGIQKNVADSLQVVGILGSDKFLK
jgi:tripartite-type tricarboxylate transporter receptor subunit TctC